MSGGLAQNLHGNGPCKSGTGGGDLHTCTPVPICTEPARNVRGVTRGKPPKGCTSYSWDNGAIAVKAIDWFPHINRRGYPTVVFWWVRTCNACGEQIARKGTSAQTKLPTTPCECGQ